MNDNILTPKQMKEAIPNKNGYNAPNEFADMLEKLRTDGYRHKAFECCTCGRWFMSTGGFRQHNKNKHDRKAQMGICVIQEGIGKIEGNKSILEANE